MVDSQSNVEGSEKTKLTSFPQSSRAKQSLPLGLVGGVVAAGVGAGMWAAVTALTGYQIGWMAVGVGFLVGIGVRLGRGTTPLFGVLGATLSLLACLAGNLWAVLIIAARELEIPFSELVGALDVGMAGELMQVTFGPLDLLFYAIAVYEGYKFARVG